MSCYLGKYSSAIYIIGVILFIGSFYVHTWFMFPFVTIAAAWFFVGGFLYMKVGKLRYTIIEALIGLLIMTAYFVWELLSS